MLTWEDDESKTFLEACLHEIITNGREGCGLKKNAWKVIAEKMMKEHGKELVYKQMRNHYEHFKSKYAAWVKLKNRTGNIYDPIKNKFNLTDEEWKIEGQLHKYVGSLKSKPLLFPDLCTQIFEGSTATGAESWGPSSTIPRQVEEISDHDVDGVQMEKSTQREDASEGSSAQSKKKTKGGKKRDSKALEVEEEIVKLARTLIQKNERVEKSDLDTEIDSCMEKLKEMKWGEEEERHKTALMLFCDSAEIRKVWLRLPPSSCESWVMGMGRKLGYI